MATQSSFKQQCPSCEAMVPIRDPKLIGRKIDCPKCKYRFIVEEPVDDVEEIEEEASGNKDKSAGITNKKPAAGKAAKGPAGRRADDDEDELPAPKKKQGGSGMLIAGIALAAVAVIALAVGAVFLFTGDSDEDKPARSQARSAPPATTENVPTENKKKEEPAAPKPRQDDITNLLPNDTQVVVNLPLDYLLGNSKVNQALLRTPGAFHEGAFKNIWGILPRDVRRVVIAYSAEKKSAFSVMRTAAQLREDQIVARLKLKAEAPINGLKHYIVKRPFDALSTLFLKGGAQNDKVALHFMDQFTVVCADVGPMTQFLKDKGQPKQLTTQPAEQEQGGGGGMQGGGMQGGPPAGMQGGPPAGMQGGQQRPGGGQPGSGGFGPGGPGGPGGKPPMVMGGGQQGMPGGQQGGLGFQPPINPNGMPGGMMPPGMTGSSASISTSYMTIDPHLKAVLDQAEKTDKNENQNVLLSVAASTSSLSVGDMKTLMAQQGGNIPKIPDIGFKFALDSFRSQLKAVAFAVTEFRDSKLAFNAAVEAKDANLAQDWEKKITDAVPGLLLMSGLDLVAKNPADNNAPANQAAGNNMPGMQGGMMGMMGGGMQQQQQQQQMQRQMMMQMRMQGGGMRGGPMPPGAPGAGGMQPQGEGEKQEEKGKRGNYEIWTKDSVLAVGLNLNIDSDQYKQAGMEMERAAIALRGIMAMANRSSHIHELAAATQAYLEAKGHFPRGTVQQSPNQLRSALGWRPDQRVSWMKDLLPYLANGEYKEIIPDDKTAWYEDKNALVGLTVVPHFVAPIPSSNPLYFYVPYPNLPVKGPSLWAATNYVGMAGVGLDAAEYRDGDQATAKKRGVFGYDRETKKKDITDGLDQTIVLIQVPPEPKSPWIAGGGSTVRGVSEDRDCVQSFVSTEYEGKPGTFAIMGDGKVRFIPASIDPKTFQALCTIAGGDKIKDLDKVAPEVPPPEDLPAEPELKADQPAPVEAPALPTPEPAKPAGWTQFTSKEGGFTVNLPAGTVTNQDVQANSPAGNFTVHIHGVKIPGNGGEFVTIHSAYPDAAMQGGAEAVFERAKTGVSTFVKTAKITSETKITAQGHPGREWTIDLGGQGTMKARVYLVKNRLIQLLAGSERGKVADKDVQAFFDSFKITTR